MGKVWMIASGKGGVGKSTITAALAVALARHRRLVCVVDLDTGLKGVDLMLDVQHQTIYDLFDLIEENCTMEQALVQHGEYKDLYLISTSQAAKPDALDGRKLRKITDKLRKRFDFVLLDCPAGIGNTVFDAARAAEHAVIVVTPDDMAMRDAERLSSMLFEEKRLELHLCVNRTDKKLIRDGLMESPEQIANYLDVPLIGEVPSDESIYRALLMHQSASECGKRSVALPIERMALRMEGGDAPFESYRVRRSKWFQRIED